MSKQRYNQAIDDAAKFLKPKIGDLRAECFQHFLVESGYELSVNQMDIAMVQSINAVSDPTRGKTMKRKSEPMTDLCTRCGEVVEVSETYGIDCVYWTCLTCGRQTDFQIIDEYDYGEPSDER